MQQFQKLLSKAILRAERGNTRGRPERQRHRKCQVTQMGPRQPACSFSLENPALEAWPLYQKMGPPRLLCDSLRISSERCWDKAGNGTQGAPHRVR